MCCCIDYFECLLLSDAERSKPSAATGDRHSPDSSGQEEYGGGDGGTPSIVGTPSSSGGTNTPSVTHWDLDNIPRFVPHASSTSCWCGVDCFYTSLFSALEWIDCTLVACDSEWMSDYRLYECVFECSLKCVLAALFGFTRLLPYWHTFCVDHKVIQSCTSSHWHFMPNHIHRVRGYLAVTCHLHF